MEASGRECLQNTCDELLAAGVKVLVLDFYNCQRIPNSGYTALIRIAKRCVSPGAILALQNLDPDVQTVLELTRLDTFFDLTPRGAFAEKCRLFVPEFEKIDRELVDYFARNPDRLTDLDWRKFELLLDAVFRNHGFRTELGSGRADGGIDLRLVQSDACGELITLVQAKKYEKHRPIRLEAVQAFCAVIDDQKANRGLFVTTSRYLPGVRVFAERQRHRLTLADSADVARWCEGAVKRMIEGSGVIRDTSSR
jgi:anti-anti-sigma regulatory factor